MTTRRFITLRGELSPFSKRSPDDDAIVERFEAFCGGMEIANAYSELNDPLEQRERFEQRRRAAAAGDEEHADGRGLPAGARGRDADHLRVGMGIDRLMMVLLDKRNIREVILFPALRVLEPDDGGA